MEKTILIKHPLQSGNELATVPLQYKVIKEGNKTTIHCKVFQDKKPEWLTLTEFSIPSDYTPGNPGVTATRFSEVKCNNPETALFLFSVYNQICVAEEWSEVFTKR